MQRARALLAVLLLLPVVASAKTINVRGEGVASCSAWTDAHTRKTDRHPVQDSWLLGFVNATSASLDIPGVDDVSAIGAYGMPMRFNITESMMLVTNTGAAYDFANYRARTRGCSPMRMSPPGARSCCACTAGYG